MSNSLFSERKTQINDVLKNKESKIRFLGVGGVGMYSLIRLTHLLGYKVSGRDRSEGFLFSDLKKRGISLSLDSDKDIDTQADLLVYSHAVPISDKEIVCAKEENIPALTRAEYMGALMKDYYHRIGVSGSHGKSTSVGMLSEVFSSSALSPTVISGAPLSRRGLPLIVGEREYLIYEACEYRDSFLSFSPELSLFTNLELDHTDYFNSLDEIKRSFLSAINLAERAVLNRDDENLASLIPSIATEITTYGIENSADYMAKGIEEKSGFYSYDVCFRGENLGRITLSVPGKFNIYNSLGVFAVSHLAGIDSEIIRRSLSLFSGVERRLQFQGKVKGSAVYYDYAHHPTEIRAAIDTLRLMHKGKISVIFRPHTYSRTEALFSDFVSSLSLFDRAYICEIDAIREAYNPEVSAELLASAIGDGAEVFSGEVDSIDLCDTEALVIMGAADLSKVLFQIKKLIKKKD